MSSTGKPTCVIRDTFRVFRGYFPPFVMTALEQETLGDGFYVALVCIVQRGGGPSAVRAVLFDGGRAADAMEVIAPGPLPPSAYLDLRRFLARVASPPHILVACGTGWQTVLDDALAEHADAFRLLDLRETAVALAPDLKPGSDLEELAGAYGSETEVSQDGLPFDLFEQLLWSLLAEAGGRAMTWADLLAAAEGGVHRAPFQKYRFDAVHLDALPEAPGVYLLRDVQGRVLYVGKSADLARRLWDYFRDTRRLDAKLEKIRDQVSDIEFVVVGSELEALLEEHRLIAEHAPRINVQRTIAEGASRYDPPLLPVALLELPWKATPSRGSLWGRGERGAKLF